MVEITHDPTRGWLLLTPDGQIEMDEKDEDALLELVDPTGDNFQNSHVYSVDAEFEVGETSSGIVTINNQTSGMVFKKIARLVKAKEKQQNMANFNIDNANDFENPTDSVTSDGTPVKEDKYFEVYCLKFSQVIHADSLFSAVLQFVKDNPFERVILAEDTTLFHAAKEITPKNPTETQDELWRELESKHLVLYADAYYPVVTDEGKSKFRIERI